MGMEKEKVEVNAAKLPQLFQERLSAPLLCIWNCRVRSKDPQQIYQDTAVL